MLHAGMPGLKTAYLTAMQATIAEEVAVPVHALEGSTSGRRQHFRLDARPSVEHTTSAGRLLLVSMFVWSYKEDS